MKKGLVWVDLETTGLEAGHHGLVEIALLFEKDGEIVDKYSSKVNCGAYATRDVACDPTALRINKTTVEEIAHFPEPQKVLNEIDELMHFHYNGTRVGLAGYNVSSFDKLFLEDFYKSNNAEYWKHFHHKPIDVFELYKCLQYMGVMKPTYNQKLVTLVSAFGLAEQDEIDNQAHGALWDIEKTRELWKVAEKQLLGGCNE